MTTPPLKAQLEAACQDLWWSSEADYPVEVVWCELPASQHVENIDRQNSIDKVLIRQIAGCQEDTQIASRPFDTFFDKYLTPKGWHTKEDKQQLKQLEQLKNLITEALLHPQVYRCGDVEITLCVVGYFSGEILAGFKTCVVET
ncbi:MAG: nuclease A inhibitor family protein [Phormidesmis sp.]